MRVSIGHCVFVGLLGCVGCLCVASPLHAEANGESRTFVVNRQHLAMAKNAWQMGDPTISADVAKLISDADKSLSAGPFSVTFSPEVAPSGDPHDILSYGYYWWPNPDTPDGLPWIPRDGFGNTKNEIDWNSFGSLKQATWSLSLAYYFTGEERYAEKSASLLRTWFLDPETRMNPRDEYSNVIPGVSPGSFNVPGFANTFHRLIDAAGILEASAHWTDADKRGLQQWLRDLTAWAETSPKGARQRDEPSNHGTNYDFLFTLTSVYNDDLELAESHYLNYVLDRLPGQLAQDGSNPLEMTRANNLLYHRYNLGRAMELAAVAGGYLDSLDLFHHQTDAGSNLRTALDFLLPYMVGDETWDRWPGTPFALEPTQYYLLLRSAAVYYHDPTLLEAADRLGYRSWGDINLTHPEAAVFETLWIGDANLDGVFDSSDVIDIFQAGKYERDTPAGWAEGDWNRDHRFNSSDLVAAFIDGGYEQGPRTDTTAVPEPSGCLLLILAVTCGLISRSWKKGAGFFFGP